MKKNLLNLKMAVIGLGMIFSTAANAATFTAALSGNWSSAATWGGSGPSGLVSGDNIIIPSGVTVNMDMDITFTSGLIITNSFNVMGSLNSTTNKLIVTQGSLTGSGSINIKRLEFTNSGTTAFTGTMNIGTMVNSNSSLLFSTMANVTDSLILESGILGLNSNANVILAANSTIRVNNGSLAITGSGILNAGSSHNVLYTGSSKTSGLELSGSNVSNLWIHMTNNSQSLTLGSDFVVNGNVGFTNGKLNMNGRKLTIMGDLSMGTGNAFISNSSSELTINGSGSLASSLIFDAGSSINNMTINRSGATVKLASSLNVAGNLHLMNGDYLLDSGSMMTMNAGSSIQLEGGTLSTNSGSFVGTAAYDVQYSGTSTSNSGVELTGSGLNNMSISLASTSSKVVLTNSTSVAGAFHMNSGNIDLNGKNLILNGSMSQGTASASFIGNANSELHLNLTSSSTNTLNFDQSNHMLSRLKLNLTAASSSMTLGSDLSVVNELNITKGKLHVGNSGNLMIMSTGTITNYDNNNYIVTSFNGTNTVGGHLVMNVTSNSSSWVTFPVGTENNYSPAYVQQNSAGTTGNFMVSAVDGFLSNGTSGSNLAANTAVVDRTWFVESESGVTVNMNLKLGWTASAEANGFNHNSAILRHYTNSNWDMTTAATASAGANSTFELSRNGLTSLSPFGVTDANTTVGIKTVAANSVNFDVYPNPAKETVSVKSPNASATCKYELIDITGRTLISTSNAESINKFDVSKLDKGYYFMKVTDNTSNTAATKRFIKE